MVAATEQPHEMTGLDQALRTLREDMADATRATAQENGDQHGQ